MKTWNPAQYDAWYETPLGEAVHRLEKDLVFSLAGVKKGEKALDAGCGTGNYSIELSKKGAITTGFDSSPDMLALAVAKARKEGLAINFIQADALSISALPDNSFDIVLSVGMLCFVKEREGALVELRRVLKPGGRLVVGVLNRCSPWAVLRRLKGMFKETIYNQVSFISPAELDDSLKKAGFKVKELKTCVFFLPINCRVYLKLADIFETVGAKAAPERGAFLVALAIK